jgi:phosphatidate cytidylyltransferase
VLAAIVAASIFLLDTRWAAAVFGAFWCIGALEWSRLAQLGRTPRLLFAGAVGVFILAIIGFGLPGAVLQAGLWLALAGWALTFLLIRRFPQPMPTWPIVVIGLVVLPGAWLAFYALHAVRPGLILAGLVIVWSADTGAYFVGRGIGRTPLAPRVSPKKTWEGVVGGVAAAAIVGAIAASALDLSLSRLALLAAISALISVGGDLGISMLKRRVGVKDSGMLLPGHGGVLDRFDGVTAALPFFVLGLQFAHVLD